MMWVAITLQVLAVILLIAYVIYFVRVVFAAAKRGVETRRRNGGPRAPRPLKENG